jgi:hypothetical protein
LSCVFFSSCHHYIDICTVAGKVEFLH